MPGIFISYRNIKRSYAPMLIDRELARRFGPGNVFQAGRSNLPATHVPSAIKQWLEHCTLLIALIDPPWATEDLRLLHNPKDWVRREIAYALEHGKTMLPVLLDGAEMPKAKALPGDIAALTHNIALRMESRTADTDLLRLIGEVERLAPDLVLATLIDPEPPTPLDPAALLRAEYQVFPFRHRDELDELASWCLDSAGPPVLLVTGALGAGKTRLGLRLSARLRGLGWPAGLLSMPAPAEALSRLSEIGTPCLVVIDDAETRQEHVHAALRSLASAPKAPGRLLLLARSGGEWLEEFRNDRDDGVAALADSIQPLVLPPLRPAKDDFGVAWTALAGRLGLPAAAPPVPPPTADTMLEVQAAALAHLLGSHDLTGPPLHRIRALDLKHWERVAAAFGLPTRTRTLAEVMTVVTLFGAGTEQEADNLLAVLRAFQGAPRSTMDSCRDFLRTVLPGPAPLNPLQPEQLAEDQVADFLGSGYWLADVLSGVTDQQARTALIVLSRCLGRHPGLSGAVTEFLMAAPSRLLPLAMTSLPAIQEPALLVAPMTAALDHVPAAGLSGIVDALPQRSEALAWFAVAATERALAARRDAGITDVTTARLAGQLAARLAYLRDRPADAAAAARFAVSTLTSLGEQDTAVTAELAEAHATLALALDLDPAAREEAMAAGERAIADYRALPAEDRYSAALATALNNQSVRLQRTGLIQPALTAAAEASTLTRPLHEARPERFRSLHADVQDNLAVLTRLAGHPADALHLSREALTLRRVLAAARPDAYRPQLAGTLYNLGLLLAEQGQDLYEPHMLWTESLAIFDAVATREPERYSGQRDRVRNRLDARKAAGDD
jgi:tetratricopeptide (TPR) repeat protein